MPASPSEAPPPARQRVAMLVFNPCAPDHRVQKEAEYLSRSGRAVRIYCLARDDLPTAETVNGVEYRRFGINWRSTLTGWLKKSLLNR